MRPLLGRRRRADERVIVDRERRLGDFSPHPLAYDVSLIKERVARDHVLGRPGEDMTFLDVGARDGRLDYLLGIEANLHADEALYAASKGAFDAKYRYYALDLEPAAGRPEILTADVCDDGLPDALPDFRDFFDVVYSNNVFEHLRRPWVAARNLLTMLKPGGLCVTIAPFAIRYHASPGDYFRYTHTGLTALFAEQGPVRELVSGYDITGRRNNWQGMGAHDDICPVDEFGAWRENWFVINILEKTAP
jgi:SAM-dependent methyltransferase